ncbi:hypothetical protein MKW98_008659 [Papaver atlanticum]|uniref:Capsular polysaccharide assembling protein CapF C-terminal domain-containing protein n=1 Tax=Papaver atlanticum TaxID=357466 RepID=A0AAD4X7S5_9MAGN|nr:hypothetical protein MKW98_008659 [Papaver atlanticum]
MANPRRVSLSNFNSNSNNPTLSLENPSQQQTQSLSLSSIIIFFKRPHAFPILLSVFLFLTWVSLRLQHFHHYYSPQQQQQTQDTQKWSRAGEDDKANLVRFSSDFPSKITKDKRGWMLDPVSIARAVGLPGGAVSCSSVHVGEIRPGGMRGNHRHYTCNETFVIWGGEVKYRLENHMMDEGYAEVTVGADEVAVATSPSGTAHALVNVDPVRTAFLLGCQDSTVTYNSSSNDFNVWKDLS